MGRPGPETPGGVVIPAKPQVVATPVSNTGAAVRDALQKPARVDVRHPPRDLTRDRVHKDRGIDRDPVRPKKTLEPPKKVEKVDDRRPHCKSRPERNELRGSGGGGAKPKAFVPWCEKKS